MLNLSVMNHEDGQFYLCYGREQANVIVNTLLDSGTERSSLTIIEGEELEIEQVPRMEYDYKVKDKTSKL